MLFQSSIIRRPLLAACVLMMLPAAWAASNDDEQFIEGLRKRRLFSLAEKYCTDRLSSQQLAPRDRVQLTIELIRVASTQAINAPPDERPPIWEKADAVADRFIAAESANPRLILVRVQKALTHLAHGQLLRQELEAGAAAPDAGDRALGALRSAVKQLDDIDDELTKEIPLSRRRTDDELLSADELFSLQNNVRYQLARAHRNRALCFPAESVDRVDALTQVAERHIELLRRLTDDDPLRWSVRIESVACQRSLANFDGARQTLTALVAAVPPLDIQLEARAEAARLELDTKRPKVALSVLALGRQIEGQVSPELDFAHLETFDALAKDAGDDEQEKAEWQKKAVAMAELIEQTHGPYWSRRANLLLVRSAGSGGGSHDLEILIRVADDLYVKRQFDEAIAAYDKAAEQALSMSDAQQSFTLFYKAALVEHTRQRHAPAAARLRSLGLRLKSHPQAADAHLLAAWNAAQLAAATAMPDEPEAVALYTDLLEEHLTNWPAAASANKARMWLARLREHQRAWSEATDFYLEVSPDCDQYDEAIESAARCGEQHFAALKSEGQQIDAQAKLSAARFEDLIYGENRELPKTWTATQRTAALAAGRIRLQFASADHEAAGTILEAALRASSDAPAAWQSSVRALLVVALAGQPARRGEASRQLQAIADSSPQQLLEILDGLAAIARSARREAAVEIARLQLDAINTIGASDVKLDAAGKLHLQRIRAGALAAAGQPDEALKLFESLAKENPRDGNIQESYAQLLLESTDKKRLEQAVVQWRIVDRGSREQTERWYRAKYSIALAHYKLGEKQRAAQLIEYLKITPPGLDDSPLKREFEELLVRCKA